MKLTSEQKKFLNEIPYFIKIRGCINCDSSKALKKEKGYDYGFDHEKMARCMLMGCSSRGVSLHEPFLDPASAIKTAKERGYTEKNNPNEIKNIRAYILDVKKNLGIFYKRMGISLDNMLKELQ
jgi:hypothetical protein